MVDTYRGVVRGNVVLLPDDVVLPNDAQVEVRIVSTHGPTEDVFSRILAHRKLFAGRRIGIDEIIDEDRREHEEHPDTWMR